MGQDPKALDAAERTVIYSLVGETPLSALVVGENPALIAASRSLAEYDLPHEHILKERLTELQERYDYVLIDCAPTLSDTTVASLTASDYVLIPTELDALSVYGINDLFDTIALIRQRTNPGLKVMGVLPTKYNQGYKNDEELLTELREALEPDVRVFDPITARRPLTRRRAWARPSWRSCRATTGARTSTMS